MTTFSMIIKVKIANGTKLRILFKQNIKDSEKNAATKLSALQP